VTATRNSAFIFTLAAWRRLRQIGPFADGPPSHPLGDDQDLQVEQFMNFRTASSFALAFAALLAGAPAGAQIPCAFATAGAHDRACLQTVQFDTDDDGVAGCVNQCKLDLEICLGQRPAGESSDRCDKIEDACEDACYNSGPAGSGNN
jgi:hypothetical protein